MKDETMFVLTEDGEGIWEKYDDTYDITIHCRSQEENERVMKIINAAAKSIQRIGESMKIVLDDGAYMPEKAHRADAGYDLRTPKRVVLRRGENVTIDTGVHMQIPDGWYGQLFSKSGLNVKHDIVSLGGTVDSGFTGSIVAKLYNLGDEDYVFEAGDKIVQIVFMPCGSFTMTQVDSLEATERGDKGFGSSGR